MDSDNPLGGIIGTVLLISFLPTILQALSGLNLGGGQTAQNPQNTGINPFVPVGGGQFSVTQPTVAGGYVFMPGQTYSTGRWNTPIQTSNPAGPRAPATIQDAHSGPGSLFGAMRGGGVAGF